MGLLNKFAVQPETVHEPPVTVHEPPVTVHEAPVAVREVPNAPHRPTALDIKRDPHGFIESATGYNAAGEKVNFEFVRNGKKNLERIKVKI